MAHYQSFDIPNMSEHIAKRVEALRALFPLYNIDGYLIPRSDAFRGEYVPKDAERLAYVTGFTGSWGLSLVMDDKAELYVDSRYILQAPEQTDTDIFSMICVSDTPLAKALPLLVKDKQRIGYDASLFSPKEIERFTDYLKEKNIEWVAIDDNLVDKIWDNKPLPVYTPIIAYPLEYAGRSASGKIESVSELVIQKKCDCAILALPESLCWLLNVRGDDVPHTPFVLAYGILYADDKKLEWFVGQGRITSEVQEALPENVIIKEPEDFYKSLGLLKNKNILYDPEESSQKMRLALLEGGANLTEGEDICLLSKAIKNKSEIAGVRQAHIRDGLAVCRFGAWLEENETEGVTEIDAVNILEQYRRETGLLRDISFDTIAGSGHHGAIVHYRVTTQTNRKLQEGELFLCDSGGQYLDGTTDITRVFAIGVPTDEMRMRYTQVLKGHLAVSRARFPEKTTGSALDSLARMPLWQAGIDFDHGTGHGVGAYLSVHEGPQGISSRSKVPFQAGMLLSNEPGYYQAGAFGIRIENVELVTEAEIPTGGERKMLGMEAMTLVPYERRLINVHLLSEEEIVQINLYHKRVFETLFPLADALTQDYLERKCSDIGTEDIISDYF